MTLTKPSNYWIAKSLGGKAEEDADAAMGEIGQVYTVLFVLFLLGGIVYFILSALGLV